MFKSGIFNRSRGMGESFDLDDSLEYEMWDDEFDFVGPQWVSPVISQSRGTSDSGYTEDLFSGGPLTPHLPNGVNGGKKTQAHQWCDNLTDQVQLLQQQVTTLADTQSTADDRYARAKAENAVLQARIHMLDEQIREIESRCEERIAEEQKRSREAISRIERDRDSHLAALSERLAAAEGECSGLKQEVGRLRGVAETLRMQAETAARSSAEAQEQVGELAAAAAAAREAERREREAATSAAGLLAAARQDLLKLRESAPPPPDPALDELRQELVLLRSQNKSLCETHEELQAQILTRGVEEGRNLLNGVNGPLLHTQSLAHELSQMSDDQLDGRSNSDIELEKLQKTLKEQQDVNIQLRNYIDGILLAIVENYPQLLEIKNQKHLDTKS